MNELIKITEKEGQQLVSARELHEFLEIGQDFTSWMKRMIEYGFEEGKDFTLILVKSTGGRPSQDYAITIDMAKEISMIQRSEKGKQARRYFIQCEKKLKEVAQDQYKELSPELKAIFTLDKKQQAIEEEVKDLKDSLTLSKAECDELQAVVHKIGVSLLGGKNKKAYKDVSLRSRVYSDIQQQLRREFGVNKYSWIKHNQFERAKEIVNNYKLPLVLEDEITLINNQIEMEDM